MLKPITGYTSLGYIDNQYYNSYLPNAFDESMTILQKVNYMIEYFNRLLRDVDTYNKGITDNLKDMKKHIEDAIKEYENFRKLIESDLLPESTKNILTKWLGDGTLKDIINNDVFNMKVNITDFADYKRMQEKTYGLSLEDFPQRDGDIGVNERLQRAIDYIEKNHPDGCDLIIPRGKYKFAFIPGSTIKKPTRTTIKGRNINIIGTGNPVIEMVGVTIDYLKSIDDYVSSGRDIFSVFSFQNAEDCKVKGITFKGEYNGTDVFRYQSPRAIAVAFKGTTRCGVSNIAGYNIMGNVVNFTNSSGTYDAPFKECVDNTIYESYANTCLENAFNFMGGTRVSKASKLSAYGCANGLESASKSLVVSDCIFQYNRGSGLGLSGEKQVVINCILTDSTGEEGKDNGYGIIATGGRDITVSGTSVSSNKSYGLMLYPGVKDVKVDGCRFIDNGQRNTYKIDIYITGTAEKKCENITISDTEITNQQAVTLISSNNTKGLTVFNCTGKTLAGSSAIINNQNEDSCMMYNKFDKPVAMNDAMGQTFQNGNVRYFERSTMPTTGEYKIGDVITNKSPSPGHWVEMRCIQAGTFGVNDPLFKVTKQNGPMGAVTAAPQFEGQFALTKGSAPAFYVAIGTSSASDWLKLN